MKKYFSDEFHKIRRKTSEPESFYYKGPVPMSATFLKKFLAFGILCNV